MMRRPEHPRQQAQGQQFCVGSAFVDVNEQIRRKEVGKPGDQGRAAIREEPARIDIGADACQHQRQREPALTAPIQPNPTQ